MPVCRYIDGLAPRDQPGVHVRRVHGKELTDEEMIQYYSGLAQYAGGEVRARYRNAICLVMDDETMFDYDGDDIANEDHIFMGFKNFFRKSLGL